LTLGALALAACSQRWVQEQPWGSVAGFALAAILLILALRRRSIAPERPAAAPPAFSRAFGVWVTAGILLCTAAGVLVYQSSKAFMTHRLWLAGLVVLAGAALWPDRGVHPAHRRTHDTFAYCAALALVAALIFGWSLSAIPAEVHGDDAEVGLDAIQLLNHFNLFKTGWYDLPHFHAFPTALGFVLFGRNLVGLRATSAALGVGSVLLLFGVVRRLWGTEVAVIAAFLLACQRFFIHLSRAGYHYIDAPFLSLLVVWLFLRLWQERRRGPAVWCGIAIGLGIQTYYAARIVPLLLAVTWLCFLVRTPVGERGRRLAGLAVVAVVALAVAAPMVGYFATHWDALVNRTLDTSVFYRPARDHLAYGYHTDRFFQIVSIQLRAALTLFNATGDTSMQYRLPGALFEPVSAALFVLGLAVVLARFRERRSQLALIWIAAPLIAGAALTIDTPFYPRISGLVPFAVVLIALAIGTVGDMVRAAVPTAWGRRIAGLATAATLAWIAAVNLHSYFVEYAPRYRHSPCLEIAAWVQAHGGGKTTYMIGSAQSFSIGHPTIAFLAPGNETRDIDDLADFLRTESFNPSTAVFVIMPQALQLVPSLERAVGPLDLQGHRTRDGEVAFVTAIPQAQGVASDPAERFDQPSAVSPAIERLGGVLAAIVSLAQGLLAACGVATLILALTAWSRQPRRPGASALAEPWRVRWRRWAARLVGPDARDVRAALPTPVVVCLFIGVVALAVALRVVDLAHLPAGFFCDEAGNGYNAYSLLHTARDETGARLPLYVWSFGVSYKNPIFIYSAMLPTALLGPTELAVRLTAAAYGVATVIAIFFLGRALMGSVVGLIAALLLAVCPWHLHFSRIGFELITLPFFFTLGLTSLVRWSQGRRTLPQAMVLFGLCLYTYVPAKLIVPLFLAGFACLSWRPLIKRWQETALAAALLALTATPVVLFDLYHREQSGSYFRETTVLAKPAPPLELAQRVASNYAAFFSPEFLFEDSNDTIVRHRVADHGELYPFFAPLLILGAAVALLRRERAMRLPLLWLALYPLAPALMNEIPSASRGFVGAPAFCLLAAIGAGAVLRVPAQLSRRRRIIFPVQAVLTVAGLAVVIPAVRGYWALYRDQYPLYSAKYYTGFQYGHRQVVDYFRQHYDDYDVLLLTTRLSNQPDSFLRFYDGLRQPPRTDIMPPFEHRPNMMVGNPEAYDHYEPPGRRLLFAVLPDEVPLFADADEKERILAPDGSAAFVIVSAHRLKDFVSTWRVFGLLPEDDQSPPPTWTPENPPPENPPRENGAARWHTYDLPSAAVKLNDFFTQNADHACAWAVNFVTTEEPRDLRVFAGFDDTGEVWVNGERVPLQDTNPDGESLVDAQIGTLHLQPGRNAIAVRSCEVVADWRFYFRLANLDGTPVEGLEWTYGPRTGAAS
jgi:4-amino-4-deoxy-L-arabinose transferase-like glycosyltransferase